MILKYEKCFYYFGNTYTNTERAQRRLAWHLCKNDMQIREAFHIFNELS